VIDTGVGIPAEFLPYIFDRFRQAEDHNSKMRSGLGLGLAIVRHLVELHHGSIAASSAGPGKGAVFTLRFPFKARKAAGVGN
jgi:signal transduction histidine kinase